MMMGLISEFISHVNSGFGFIYQDDVSKYYQELFGESLPENDKQELLDDLREKNLLKDGNSKQK